MFSCCEKGLDYPWTKEEIIEYTYGIGSEEQFEKALEYFESFRGPKRIGQVEKEFEKRLEEGVAMQNMLDKYFLSRGKTK